jgi:plasmid maintenance system killer protein
MSALHEIIKIAEIHVHRIHLALKHTHTLFPMGPDAVQSLPEDHMVWIDLLINRFGKLQDIIGSKIIDLFLESQGEIIEGLTMLDKIYKMEKLKIIKDAQTWKDMRSAKNHIEREYPDHPELMAIYLNQIYSLIPSLLEMFDRLKKRMKI